MSERSDEELVSAYRKGEIQAFETLLRRHEKGVFNFSRRMLGNPMEAEEVTQVVSAMAHAGTVNLEAATRALAGLRDGGKICVA